MRAIGIDIGGTKIRAAVLAGKKIERSVVIQTPQNKKTFLKSIAQLIYLLSEGKKGAVGVGLPGIVDRKTGKIINLPNLAFLNGLNIFAALRKHATKIAIDNDLKCMLLAEQKMGTARNLRNAFMLAVGTGIGGALLIDNKVFYGAGMAGEIGHMVIAGNKTLEQLAGGKTLKSYNQSELNRIGINLGIGLANVINLLSPEAVILGGGTIEKSGAKIIPIMKREMLKHLVDPRAKKTKIVQAKLKPLGGAIGAALLVQ